MPELGCPACGHENREGARFCDGCGAALAQSCPTCGTELRAAARFCDHCGRSLTAEIAEDAEAKKVDSASSAVKSFVNGRYQVKQFLGEGGKKRVYLAHDTRLDRDVAFALIKTEGLDEEGRERVTREAQAMGKMGTHPHIVSVFDMGEEAGQPYLVTELLGGGDIQDLLERAEDHRLPIERAVEIAQQVCRGLEFAHGHGLVHRDLKPGNVWLTGDTPLSDSPPQGGRGTPPTAKIGDFGLAVALDRSRLTVAGMMVGTVSYMPPEQAMGGEVTPRSDLYSLGAMLYEMVCGRPPFLGDEHVAIIGQHLNTPPVSPTWHRPDCPVGLEALILRLLEKDSNKRPASAAEVQEALVGAGSPGPPPAERGDLAPTNAAENPLYRRTFVGREQELRQLQDAFDAANSGHGSIAMVVGEPGIGKSTLSEQLATYTSLRGATTLVGHCYEQGSLSFPYLPFVEALRSYVLTREPEGLKEDLGTGAAEVARIVSEIRDRVDVGPSTGSGSDLEEQRWRLFHAVAGFLRNASRVRPVLLVLEDLHDADSGTLDLLVHLSRNIEGARLLVVGTYRDVEVDRGHALSGVLAELRRAGDFLRIPLRGLSVDEVHRMMKLIRGQEVPWSRAEVIHRQTEGNPLFVQEVLRYLVEEGLVVREGGRYVLTDETIPAGLRDVIGKRLSRLSEKASQILSIAAVIGRDFRLDVLGQVVGPAEDVMEAALEEAQERAIIEELSAAGGAVAFRFTHAFFRQTLYEAIFAARRIRWHRQVAEALEAIHARRLEDHAAELAEHYAHSSQIEDLRKAVSYGELAARRALGVYAYGEAVRHLEAALKAQEVLDPDDQVKRCDLLLELAEALLPGEPMRAATEVAEEAFALAETLGDEAKAARSCETAGWGLIRYGAAAAFGGPVAARWAERANRYSRPGTKERASADRLLALVGHGIARFGDVAPAADRTMETARQLGDPDLLFNAGAIRLILATAPDREALRLETAGEFATRDRTGVSNFNAVLVLYFAGWTLLAWGRRAEAETCWREVEVAGRRTQDPNDLLFPLIVEANSLYVDGELPGALDVAGRLVARGEEAGSPMLARFFSFNSVIPGLLHLGRPQEALGLLDEAGRDTPAGEFPPGGHPALVSRRAICLAHMNRLEEARTQLNSCLEVVADDLAAGVLPSIYLSWMLETALFVEDRDIVAALSRSLAPAAPIAFFSGAQNMNFVSAGRLLGSADAFLGNPEQAKAYYDQALEVCHKIRFRPEIALIRLGLAELLLAHYPQQKTEALEHLDFAIAKFREMKMQPSLERALKHKGLLGA